MLLILSAAVVPVSYAMVSRPALYNGLRHFVFIVPPIAVMAGIACAWGFEWLRTRGIAAWIAGIAALAWG